MDSNPENNLNRHGHRHPPDLHVVPEIIEDQQTRTDWMRVGVYSVLGGTCVGMLSERFAYMFDSISEKSIQVGFGAGVISAGAIALYGDRKYKI